MSPKRILASAAKKDIDIIGICDHNSSENSLAVMNAAKKMDVTVLPGMVEKMMKKPLGCRLS
jgi:predicted metal-dependent phosphoesterase TrpH